jgi:hypothetical protein
MIDAESPKPVAPPALAVHRTSPFVLPVGASRRHAAQQEADSNARRMNMADLVANAKTSLPGEDVIVRAVQFFTNERWRAQSQSSRVATFVGRPKIPVGLLLLTILGFLMFVVPGILMYILVVRRVIRFQNIVVTSTPTAVGTDVVITYPKMAKKLVDQFVSALPRLAAVASA